jgi:hypothetical protein
MQNLQTRQLLMRIIANWQDHKSKTNPYLNTYYLIGFNDIALPPPGAK